VLKTQSVRALKHFEETKLGSNLQIRHGGSLCDEHGQLQPVAENQRDAALEDSEKARKYHPLP